MTILKFNLSHHNLVRSPLVPSPPPIYLTHHYSSLNCLPISVKRLPSFTLFIPLQFIYGTLYLNTLNHLHHYLLSNLNYIPYHSNQPLFLFLYFKISIKLLFPCLKKCTWHTAYVIKCARLISYYVYKQHFVWLRTSKHSRRAALRTDTRYPQEQFMVCLHLQLKCWCCVISISCGWDIFALLWWLSCRDSLTVTTEEWS